MDDLNTRLYHRLIRRAVERTRFENGTLKTMAVSWLAVEAGLVYWVQQSQLFTGTRQGFGFPVNQSQLSGLLDQMAAVIGTGLRSQLETVAADLKALVELELREVPALIQTELDRAVAGPLAEAEADPDISPLIRTSPLIFLSLLDTQLTDILSSPLGGARYASAFSDLATGMVTRLRNALISGLAQGMSTAQVVRAVRGLMRTSAFQAESIVRSEYVRMSNQAALLLYDQNKALLRGVRWSSVLDSKTCGQCAVLDGRVWKNPSEALIPGSDTHKNCRCVVTPYFRSSRELDLPAATRWSMTGQVPATMTYPQWFAQQDSAMQREILGPTRYKLYRDKGYRLPDFASARGVRSIRATLASARRA